MGIHQYLLQKAYGRVIVILVMQVLLVFGYPYYNGEWTITYVHELEWLGALIWCFMNVLVMVLLTVHIVQEWMRVENYQRVKKP